MNYKQVLDFMFSQLQMYQRIGAAAYKADLNNTIAICDILDNPQRHIKSVHIAGTNGKGSVSHLMASVLQEAGYKTGLFTSPHLKDFRERIKVNGKQIPKRFVIDFVNKYYNNFNEIKPSFFEMTTGLAFDYFKKENVDISVIETGLGGRLDSTNIINPELSVITNITLDHINLLGNTVQKIAFEKAGIIKKGTPVIIGETQKEIKKIFKIKAENENAEMIYADKTYDLLSFKSAKLDSKYIQMVIKSLISDEIYKVSCPLKGNYQKKNVITALCAVNKLRVNGYSISDENITKGFRNVIKNTGLKGRWQILSRNPLTVCDTGHNVAGISEIVKQLKTLKYNRLHFVLGMVNDKDINGVLELLPKDAVYYFCSPDIPRGLNAIELFDKAKNHNLNGKVFNSVGDALKSARNSAGNNDMIFIGGSSFVVAEVL